MKIVFYQTICIKVVKFIMTKKTKQNNYNYKKNKIKNRILQWNLKTKVESRKKHQTE